VFCNAEKYHPDFNRKSVKLNEKKDQAITKVLKNLEVSKEIIAGGERTVVTKNSLFRPSLGVLNPKSNKRRTTFFS